MKTSYSFLFIAILLFAGCKSEEKKAQERFEARKLLSDLNIEYSIDEYSKRIIEGDYTAVELFLKSGMAPNAGNEAGEDAIFYGHLNILELLFENGLNTDDTGVVLTAIWVKNMDALEFLRKKGADFNKIHQRTSGNNIQDRLPLSYALDFNRIGDRYGSLGGQHSRYDTKYYEIAEFLVDNGATFRGWQRGDTPLQEIYVTDDLEERAPSLYRKLLRWN
ncbi:MAG: ankyrin repeat domain-containing protein [Balneolia bacterium]|nr:ankyrin repeat domain-containing protein [Balneolia bacterium]